MNKYTVDFKMKNGNQTISVDVLASSEKVAIKKATKEISVPSQIVSSKIFLMGKWA